VLDPSGDDEVFVYFADHGKGREDVARRVIDTHLKLSILRKMASYDVASNICQAVYGIL